MNRPGNNSKPTGHLVRAPKNLLINAVRKCSKSVKKLPKSTEKCQKSEKLAQKSAYVTAKIILTTKTR